MLAFRVWLSITSWGNTEECTCDCFHLHCQAGGWYRIGCTVFMDDGHLVGQWSPSLTGLWWLSHQCTPGVLRFAVFLNEKLDLCLLAILDGAFLFFFFFFFFFAKHIIVGLLFRNSHPSLQYSSRSCIHTSLYDFCSSHVSGFLAGVTPELVWVPFLILGLLELCQLEYLHQSLSPLVEPSVQRATTNQRYL